ncbi:putative bifunctional diguanylate cyclase/phosphodiesterase [Neptunicella sp. SCSIO 80796]|uniref:putative bifunctional diguanylate cyclase/phosphodiesterase n=1 Tax=Neptunicella plasticusilytica TaxID=3117012 RepID=UPI003A4E045D
MDQISQTLQIVSIQHELAMSIGKDLHLDNMLAHFLTAAQRRLSLSAIHLFYSQRETTSATSNAHNSNMEHYRCFPKQGENDNQQKHFLMEQLDSAVPLPPNAVPQALRQGNKLFYKFAIPEVGWIVLERIHSPIEQAILSALPPLFTRLATSCLACMEHHNLLIEVEARKQAEKTIVRQIYTDALTDLPNRKLLNSNLNKALASARRHDYFGALFFIDLDRFKIINDTMGHAVGDELLIKLTDLLKRCVREGDTLARVGGDEFILLTPNLSKDESNAISQAHRIAEKLTMLVNQPIGLSENTLYMTFSIGICIFPNPQINQLSVNEASDIIIKNADIAMYRTKHNTRNGFRFFENKMQSDAIKRANIEKQLHFALQENQFELHYQPIVDRQGQLLAAEALLRWNSPSLGMVSPAEFIPIAEESGQIIDISSWLMTEACRFIEQLQGLHLSKPMSYISVNISPKQFRHQHFVEQLKAVVERYQIDLTRLRLEITEGIAIGNVETAIDKMRQLVDAGFQFMLDDFGSGYSSLSYLHKMPLSAIKIDKSFIRDLDTRQSNQVVVNAIIDIANHFKLGCIIEGVESAAEVGYLKNRQISAFQGYYFYRPMPADALLQIIQKQD